MSEANMCLSCKLYQKCRLWEYAKNFQSEGGIGICNDFIANEIDSNQFRYETDERVLSIQEFYKLFCGMSESMQKAVKDIMIVANGGEIDDN